MEISLLERAAAMGARVGGSSAEVGEVEPINDRVLQVVRHHMPIDELFTPAHKINIRLFLEDQEFFAQIAQLLLPLVD